MYKRILLKLSGEQLQGSFSGNGGFDPVRAAWIAREIKKVAEMGLEIVVMVGGGNIIRGNQTAGNGINTITAHNTGMLGTMINGLLATDVFNHEGLQTRALTNIKADQVVDQFTHRRAVSHLQKGRVVIVCGGIGRPYLTTDTAAVSLALELNCDAVLKSTKVDGVYDKDPAKYPEATKLDTLSFQQAVENEEIKVMDKAALGLAMENKQTIIVFDLLKEGNIAGVARQEPIGTTIQ